MRKKPFFVALLLIFSISLVESPPMAKADGSVDAQDIWIQASEVDIYPEYYDGTNDGSNSIEDVIDVSWINVTDTWGVDLWNITIYNSDARIVKTDGADTDAIMIVYDFLSLTNGGTLLGQSDPETPSSVGTVWYDFDWSTPVELGVTDYIFYLGLGGDDDAGTAKVIYNTGGSNGELVETFTYPNFDDPLDGESPVHHNIHVRASIQGTNENYTVFNQYYDVGNITEARRDIDITFPSGTNAREIKVTLPRSEKFLNLTFSNGGYWNASLSESNYTLDAYYNATHMLITIPEATIASYGEDYRLYSETYAYIFTMRGLFSENGTLEGSVNVTAHYLADSDEHEVNGELPLYYDDDKPIQFTWSLEGGGSRRIYTYEGSYDIYLFTPDDDYASYSFYIKDYSGSVGSGDTYLESLRVVNGTERVIERVLIWDTVNAVPLTLTIGQIYILQVRLFDDTIYRFGYFTPGSDPTPTLTITGIAFSDQAHYVGEHISVEATRPNATHIQTAYENLLKDTTNLFVEICYMNGTQVWNDTSLSDDIIFNWYGADNETDYLVNFDACSEFYGDISYSKALVGEKTDITDPPDLDAVLGSGVRLMISIFMIYMGFIIFSAYTATIGVFSGLTITYVLNYMNFIPIPIPWTILHALMGLLIMWALAGGNK